VLLAFNLVLAELLPELVELGVVAFTIEGVVNNNDVLLIVGTSLESPVEGASKDEHAIDNHKLVVHVVSGLRVGSNIDTSISKLLDIITLVLGALVIGDNFDSDTILVSADNSAGKVVVGNVEDANFEGLFGEADVLHDSVNILLVGEEEAVHIFGFGSNHVLFNLGDVFAQVFEHFLAIVVLHLLSGSGEHSVDSPAGNLTVLSVGHLAKLLAQGAQVHRLGSELGTVRNNLFDCSEGLLNVSVLRERGS